MNPLLLAAAHPLTATDPSIGASLLKMVLGLGGVIISILAVSKVLQYLRRGAPQRRAAGSLEVLSRQSLGKGLQLAVVRFNGREVLVGIAGQQITFHEATNAALEGELDFFESDANASGSSPIAGRGLAGALASLAERRSGTLSGASGQHLGQSVNANFASQSLNSQPFAGSTAAPRSTGATVLDRLRDATTRR